MNSEPSLFYFLLSVLGGGIAHFIAWKKNFYMLAKKKTSIQLSFLQLISFFLLYVTSSLVTSRFSFLFYGKFLSQYSAFVYAQLTSMSITFLLLSLAILLFPKGSTRLIFKNSTSSILKDIALGAITWILGVLSVLIVEQICDFILHKIGIFYTSEQVAVRYLKIAMSSPNLFVSALISILVLAPCIEEFLFRGVLQNYLKQYCTPKLSIALTSICFALLHLSSSHGIGNFPLIISLFTFSCFLGFIYEKQQSLFSSISLHVTFNVLSTLRIIYLS